jgi:hypothetical protein
VFFFGFFFCVLSFSAGRGVVLLCFVIGEKFAARAMTRMDKGRKFELFVMMTGTEAQQLLCVTFF